MLYKDESYRIIGACMEVHKTLGCGFLEAVYQEALEIEFTNLSIPFQREKQLDIRYKDKLLSKKYQADFICYDKIILELKAIDSISGIHIAQVLNYLKATGYQLGIIVNFGEQSLRYKRIIL